MKRSLTFAFLLGAAATFGQELVRNGSFEDFSKCPHTFGDFYATSWWCPGINSTPDLFSTCSSKNEITHPESYWTSVKPYEGSAYAGIVAYVPTYDYHEYISTHLSRKLKEDSVYVIELAVAIPFMSYWRIPEIGVLFSEAAPMIPGNGVIAEEPSVILKLDSLAANGSWMICRGEYLATGNETCLTIGNFTTMQETVHEKIRDRKLEGQRKINNDAYLCIDGIRCYPYVDPEEEAEEETIPEEADETEIQEDVAGRVIVLNNLSFETNSFELRDEAIPELDQLIGLMENDPLVKIRVQGHTDNIGQPESNRLLSANRAESVAGYLISHGIGRERITTEGFGDTAPIAPNDTESGRTANRRVEILFLGH